MQGQKNNEVINFISAVCFHKEGKISAEFILGNVMFYYEICLSRRNMYFKFIFSFVSIYR